MKKSLGLCLLILVAAAVAVGLWLTRHESDDGTSPLAPTARATRSGAALIQDAGDQAVRATPTDADDSVDEKDDAMTPEEKSEQEAEARVDAFDALTDKWMEAEGKSVAMEDVNQFLNHFAQVPKDRKEECLQRALNLISDEHVMLLVGVLMDKTQDRELVELVFNDVLNRDEDVKQPILRRILQDKSHPCWADAAWILDVTGESPHPDK